MNRYALFQLYTKLLNESSKNIAENFLNKLYGESYIYVDNNLINEEKFVENKFFQQIFQTDFNFEIKEDGLKYRDFDTNLFSEAKFIKGNLGNKLTYIQSFYPNEDNNEKKYEEINKFKLNNRETVSLNIVMLKNRIQSSELINICKNFLTTQNLIQRDTIFIILDAQTPNLSKLFESNLENVVPIAYEYENNPTIEYIQKMLTYKIDVNNIEYQFKKKVDSLKKNQKTFNESYTELLKQAKKIANTKQNIFNEIKKNKLKTDQKIDKIAKNLEDKEYIKSIINKDEIKGQVSKKKKEQKVYVEKLFESYAYSINNEVKILVENFNKILENNIDAIEADYINNSEIYMISEIKNWFKSGVAGLAAYGALTSYMASFGNLGGYIFVAKGVSALSSFGISIGSTATVISRVSALGGPVGIAISTGLTVALMSKGLLGLGWKNELAKQIKKISKKNFIPTYKRMSSKLWERETYEAVEKGFDSIFDNLRDEILLTHKDLISTVEKNKLYSEMNVIKLRG